MLRLRCHAQRRCFKRQIDPFYGWLKYLKQIQTSLVWRCKDILSFVHDMPRATGSDPMIIPACAWSLLKMQCQEDIFRENIFMASSSHDSPDLCTRWHVTVMKFLKPMYCSSPSSMNGCIMTYVWGTETGCCATVHREWHSSRAFASECVLSPRCTPSALSHITVYYPCCVSTRKKAELLFTQYWQEKISRLSRYQVTACQSYTGNNLSALAFLKMSDTYVHLNSQQPTHTVQSVDVIYSTVGNQTSKHIMSNPHEYHDPRWLNCSFPIFIFIFCCHIQAKSTSFQQNKTLRISVPPIAACKVICK